MINVLWAVANRRDKSRYGNLRKNQNNNQNASNKNTVTDLNTPVMMLLADHLGMNKK